MKKYLILTYCFIHNQMRKIAYSSNLSMKLIYIPGFEKLRFFNGKMRMKAEYYRAIRTVPAYKTISEEAGGFIAETSKNSFVKRFPLVERCRHGKIPSRGIIIDESSGSSGMPTQWIRGEKERQKNFKFIEFGMQQLLGNEPKIMINAFAMGSWATGINISMASSTFSRVKSTGPCCDKIDNTLVQFGEGESYVILGYPPFLKYFVDNTSLDLSNYNIYVILGGESMSEGLRDYLSTRGIKKVYSSYGASDLELNIAAENNFTIELRKLLLQNYSLRQEICLPGQALPMVFQFNPADFYIETNEKQELIVSVCRTDYVTPKIRYNIKDKGQVIRKSDLVSLLRKHNIDEAFIKQCKIDIPFLFHYGRSDQTVSFFGSNISPHDIEEVIYTLPQLSFKTNSFCLSVKEDTNANKQLKVHLESRDNQSGPGTKDLQKSFFEKLAELNQDFREAMRMLPENQIPTLAIHSFGKGPFAENDIRIKLKYIRA